MFHISKSKDEYFLVRNYGKDSNFTEVASHMLIKVVEAHFRYQFTHPAAIIQF